MLVYQRVTPYNRLVQSHALSSDQELERCLGFQQWEIPQKAKGIANMMTKAIFIW